MPQGGGEGGEGGWRRGAGRTIHSRRWLTIPLATSATTLHPAMPPPGEGGGGEGGPPWPEAPVGPRGGKAAGSTHLKRSIFKRRNRGCNPPFEKLLTEAVPRSQAGGLEPTFRFPVGVSV